MIHFEQLQGDLQEAMLKAKMPSRDGLEVWRCKEAEQLPASPRSCFVTFVLARQQPAADEGGGAMGIGAKDKVCRRSKLQVVAKQKKSLLYVCE